MLSRLDLGEHRSAVRRKRVHGPGKALSLRAGQLLIQGVKQESFELVALHTVMGFTWHHITCLYVR